MTKMTKSFLLLALLAISACYADTNGNIWSSIQPSFNWVNINLDDSVTLTLYWISDVELDDDITVTLRLGVPFSTDAPSCSSAKVTDAGSISTLSFSAASAWDTTETEDDYSFFYVETDDIYVSGTSFALECTFPTWLTAEGESNPVKLALISTGLTNYITYAETNNFMNLYAAPSIQGTFSVEDLTSDANASELSTDITAKIKISPQFDGAERIIIDVSGYSLLLTAATTCSSEANTEEDATALPVTYSCSVSGTMLTYELNAALTEGTYILSFPVTTASVGSVSFSVIVYTMYKYAPIIIERGDASGSFSSTSKQSWSSGFPSISVSYGFDLTSAELPDYFGLYSTQGNPSLVMNTVLMSLKTTKILPSSSFSLEIILGSSDIIVPLSFWWDEFTAYTGMTKSYTISSNKMIISGISFSSGKEYKFGFKVAYTAEGSLTDLGKCTLNSGSSTVIESKPSVVSGLQKAFYNPAPLSNMISGYSAPDAFFPSFIAMASDDSDTVADFVYNSDGGDWSPGLRKYTSGDAVIWFGSHYGINKMSGYETAMTTSNGTFVELVLPSGLVSSSFSGSYGAYCDVHPYGAGSADYWLQTSDGDFPTAFSTILTAAKASATVLSSDFTQLEDCGWSEDEIDGVAVTSLRWLFKDAFIELDTPSIESFIIDETVFASDGDISVGATEFSIFKATGISLSGAPAVTNYGNDAIILDAFIRIYIGTGYTDVTEDIHSKSPKISTMHNMVLLTNGNSDFFDNTNLEMRIFFGDSQWGQVDLGTSIFYLSGELGTIPGDTTTIRLFFDLLEPIWYDSTEGTFTCSILGLSATSCVYQEGVDDYTHIFLSDQTGTGINSDYILNPLYSNSIDITIDAVPAADDPVSILIPMEMSYGSVYEAESANVGYMGRVSVMALDADGLILDYVTFGSGSTHNFYAEMETHVYIEYTADGTGTNDPYASPAVFSDASTLYVFFDDEEVAGGLEDGTLEAAPGGSGNTAGLLCTVPPWDITADENFDLTQTSRDSSNECHFPVLFGEDYTCIFCPELDPASTTQFDFAFGTLPYTNGLNPPDEVLSLANFDTPFRNAYAYLESIMDLQTYAGETASFGSTGPISYIMGNLDVTLSLEFVITKGIPSGGGFLLTKNDGDNLLNDKTPTCYLSQVSAADATVDGTCTAVLNSGTFLITANDDVTAGSVYVKIYGLYVAEDGTETLESTWYFTTYYDMGSTSSSSAKIETSNDGDDSKLLTLQFNPSGTLRGVKVTPVIDSNIASLTNNQLELELSLESGTTFYRKNSIEVDLGGAVTDHSGLTYRCYVRNSEGFFITYFSTCEADDLSAIKITGDSSEDFSLTDTYLVIDGYNTPATQPTSQVTATLYYAGVNEVDTNTASITPSIASYTSYSSVEVEASHDYPGHIASYTFTITPSTSDGIEAGAYIYVKFPLSYIPDLATVGIGATNSDGTDIYLATYERIVLLSNPEDVAQAGTLEFTITGVEVPYTSDDRVISIMHSVDGSTPLEFGEVTLPDFGDVSEISFILVSEIDVSTNYIRSTAEFTFNMTLDETINSDSNVYVEFNHLYGYETLRSASVSCSMTDVSDGASSSASIASNCEWIDNRVVFTLSNPASLNGIWEVSISGVPTTEFKRDNAPSLRVVVGDNPSTGAQTITASSNVAVVDSEVPDFSIQSSTLLLSISGVSSASSVLSLPIGFYTMLTVSSSGGAFKDTLTFTLDSREDGAFSAEAYEESMGMEDFVAETGKTYGYIYVAPIYGVAEEGLYTLKFSKKSEFSTGYSELPLVNVIPTLSKKSLTVTTPVDVVYGGSSRAISISTSFIPVEDITFTLTMESENGLSVDDDVTEITLGPSSTSTIIKVVHDGYTGTSGSKGTLTIATNSDASELYNSATISLTLIEDDYDGISPELELTDSTVSIFTATIKISVNVPASIYYKVAPTFIFEEEELNDIKASLEEGITKDGDIIYGQTYSAATEVTLSLTSLVADTDYTILVYGETLSGSSTANLTDTFATSSAGSSGKFTITFAKDLITESDFSTEEIEEMLCKINNAFGIPDHLLYTSEGHNCDSELTKKWVGKVEETTTERRRRILQQSSSSSDAQVEVDYREITLYLYAAMYSSDPTTLYTTMTSSTSASTAVTTFKTLLTSYDTVTGVSTLSELTINDAPSFLNVDTYSIESTDLSITISGFELDQSGIINVIATIPLTSSSDGDYVTYSYFTDAELSVATTSTEYVYSDSEEAVTYEATLTGLAEATDYDIHYYAVSNDFRAYGRSSEIYSNSTVTLSTESEEFGMISSFSIVLMSLLVLVYGLF